MNVPKRIRVSRRVFLVLALLIVMGLGTASYSAYQKIPLLELVDTTYSIEATPSVYLIPDSERRIDPRSANATAAQTFQIDKVRVSVPNELIVETQRNSGTDVITIAGPGEKMLVISPEKGYGEVVKNYQSEDSPFFGSRELRSSYDFALATMQVTPDGLTVLTPWESLVRTVVLLSFKLSETSDASVIHLLSIGSLKAVQIGDPDDGDKVVRVFLFPGQYERIDLYFREYGSAEIISVLESLVA